MTTPQIDLYVDAVFTSPYAMAVFVTLREKGLAFRLHTVDLAQRQQLQPQFQARSITWRVPVLEHAGLALSESSAITEYLEEVFAPPAYAAVYPAAAAERARARQVQAWLRSDLLSLREERPTTVMFMAPSAQPLSAAGRAAADKLVRGAQALLAGRDQLFDRWCLADTELALMLNRLLANGDPLPPELGRYVRHQWQRPAVQEWVRQPRTAGAMLAASVTELP